MGALTAEEIKEARKRRKRAEAILSSRHVPSQPEIECGCCFADYAPMEITQCEDGHLFCLDCAKRSAQNVIGLRKTGLKCISTDSCSFDFPLSEIARFLPEKEFRAYEVMLQEKEIANANLDGFVQCPFCPFGVLGVPDDTIFRCLNTEICGVDSCLKCKKKSHGKKPCEADSSATNQIAEAMTEALMRECPSCHTKFFKTEGCNKMTCTCGVKMCYICRKKITGYEHFQKGPNGCQLHDDTNARNKSDAVKAGEAKMVELGLNGTTAEKLLDGSTFKVIPDLQKHLHPQNYAGGAPMLNDLINQVRQAEAQFNHYHGRYMRNQELITSVNHDLIHVNNALFQAMERLRLRIRVDLPALIRIHTNAHPQNHAALAVELARLRVLGARYDAFLRQKVEFDGPLQEKERKRLAVLAEERLARIVEERAERRRKATERISAAQAGFQRATKIAQQARENVTARQTRQQTIRNRSGLVVPERQVVSELLNPVYPGRKRPRTLDECSFSEAIKKLNATRTVPNRVLNLETPKSFAMPGPSKREPDIPHVLSHKEELPIHKTPESFRRRVDAVIEILGHSTSLSPTGRKIVPSLMNQPGPSTRRVRKIVPPPMNQPGPSKQPGSSKQPVIFISDTPVKPQVIDLTSPR